MSLSFWTIAARLGLAILCGALLGWERELQRKPAGLRTHMMVALGAAAFTLVTLNLTYTDLKTGDELAPVDPARTIAGVIGGIGFLGAGTIIQSRGSVEGITTAAAIWVMGAIGVACGIGNYTLAATTTGLALLILSGVGWVEARMRKIARANGPGDDE